MSNLLQWAAKVLDEKKIKETLILSDDHKCYPRAIGNAQKKAKVVLHHSRVSSKRARNYQNPLFAVNYLDRQFRKDLSDHTRETVQFSKDPSCMMSRMEIYSYFHNYCKPFRIKRGKENRPEHWISHSQIAGLLPEIYVHLLVLSKGRRVFFHKTTLNKEEKKTWLHLWKNPGRTSKKYFPKYYKI